MSDLLTVLSKTPKLIGIAADHGGYELRNIWSGGCVQPVNEVIDFGDRQPKLMTIIRILSCRWPARLPRRRGMRRGHLWKRRWGLGCRQ